MVKSVVLVTGGLGLLGFAIKHVIDTEPLGSPYGRLSEDEEWIFLSSKDGDLRYVALCPSPCTGAGASGGMMERKCLAS